MRVGAYVRAKRKLRVGINGFGRIGRLACRVMCARPEEFELVWVNDLTDAPTLEFLLRFDSVHGRFDGRVEHGGAGGFLLEGKKVLVTAEKDAEKLKWADQGVDVVMECTGVYTTRAQCAKHLVGGAKRVVLSAPAKDKVDATVVLGVNEGVLTKEHKVVSNASCTTNCLAPVAKVLHESFGLKRGMMTTVHAMTNDQRLLDLPHKNLRRARAAASNIVPTTTGAAQAVSLVLPALEGRLTGVALRVPVPDGSVVDLVADLEKDASPEDINAALKKAAEGPLKGVLAYCEDEVVSSDIVGQPESSIVDAASTDVLSAPGASRGAFCKVLAWYDNEWGYSNRLVDLSALLGNLDA